MSREQILVCAAKPSDQEAIVDLLKVSLGETLMPKTLAFWKWKHQYNPFGESLVLLAYAAGKLVGVRAFLKWEWRFENRVVRAVRAVDTATHPEFQGRGIFSQLTMRLVDQCTKEGTSFIFNTPNEKSLPGYLKMGWMSLGRLKVGARMIIPGNGVDETPIDEKLLVDISGGLERCLSGTKHETAITNCSLSYIRWRYIDNPNARYRVAFDNSQTWFVFYRLKPFRFGHELRIADIFGDTREALKSQEMKLAIKNSGAMLATLAGVASAPGYWNVPMGPKVTVRVLSPDISVNFNSWTPSLGDLEIF